MANGPAARQVTTASSGVSGRLPLSKAPIIADSRRDFFRGQFFAKGTNSFNGPVNRRTRHVTPRGHNACRGLVGRGGKNTPALVIILFHTPQFGPKSFQVVAEETANALANLPHVVDYWIWGRFVAHGPPLFWMIVLVEIPKNFRRDQFWNRPASPQADRSQMSSLVRVCQMLDIPCEKEIHRIQYTRCDVDCIAFLGRTRHNPLTYKESCQTQHVRRDGQPNQPGRQSDCIMAVVKGRVREFPQHFRRETQVMQFPLLRPPTPAFVLVCQAPGVFSLPNASAEKARFKIHLGHRGNLSHLPC